jgi:hypothetical protein
MSAQGQRNRRIKRGVVSVGCVVALICCSLFSCDEESVTKNGDVATNDIARAHRAMSEKTEASSLFKVSLDGISEVTDSKSEISAPKVFVSRQSRQFLEIKTYLNFFKISEIAGADQRFADVTWPQAGVSSKVGYPNLPVLRRFVVIPHGVDFQAETQIEGTSVFSLAERGFAKHVYPRQAPIEKRPGMLQSAPFNWNKSAYSTRSTKVLPHVDVSEFGIYRGHRLLMLEVYPIVHDPTQGTLTVSYGIKTTINLYGTPSTAPTVKPIRNKLVLNPPQIEKVGSKNYLIIAADSFVGDIDAFVSSKTSQGYSVDVESIAPGTSSSAIKSIIHTRWDTTDSPDYLLLVGDTDTIPHWNGGGSGVPPTDLPYACVDRGDDWVPDIAIGRFPARTSAQLQNMIDKTLVVEETPDLDYLSKAVFMAGEDNYSVTEGTHDWVIDTYMDPAGFSSDKLYMVTYGADTSDVSNAFNDGRIYGIYSGHGDSYSWGDGPEFLASNVKDLSNTDLYSFVASFACMTGNYTVNECFMETWVREADKGAAASIGSSVGSSWDEDDILEKRLFDAIYLDSIREISPAWQMGMAYLVAHYGPSSTTRRYSEMYNLMGDPSLAVPPIGGWSDMAVSPPDAFESISPRRGRYTPSRKIYTIENNTDEALDFSVFADEPWVTLRPTSGTLAPNSSAIVVVSLNGRAIALGVGEFTANVAFSNDTNGDGTTTRAVNLVILP